MEAADGQGIGRVGILQGLWTLGSCILGNSCRWSFESGSYSCVCSRHSSYHLGELMRFDSIIGVNEF